MADKEEKLDGTQLDDVSGGVIQGDGAYHCNYCSYCSRNESRTIEHVKKSHNVSSPVLWTDYNYVI